MLKIGKIFYINKNKGFTLVESLIGVGIFVMLAATVYQTFVVISKQSSQNSDSVIVSSLAKQYLETARNLPYSQIGTIQGNPNGSLPDLPNATNTTINGITYQTYYEVTYIDDPADGIFTQGTDPAPTDYKQVKLSVKNLSTNSIKNFVTNIVPTGLENMTSGGALMINVINAVGQPVTGATISITNTTVTPSINLTRMSDSNGSWVEVGLPNSTNSYHIVVTKNGYSSDQTYATSLANPNPIKPDSTISDGQVTQITFSIDLTSNLTFNTLDQSCGAISGVGLGIAGAKLIGTPDVLKFNNTYSSNGNGQVVLSNTEWDNYTPALTGTTRMIYGSSPIQQINLLPNTTQMFNLILGDKTENSLLVIVKDGATGDPIEGASVRLTKEDLSFDNTYITGGSLWSQMFWNGGSGQSNWSDKTKYYFDDGNISTTETPSAMRLVNSNGLTLANAGSLISSTFDTGTDSSAYTTLNWQPTSQDPDVIVKFQIATNNDNETWNFIGPDGTSSSYYTTPGTTISAVNNNNRYVRYKAYLSTVNSSKNPTVTSIGVNYVSGCFTPGQVIFPGLSNEGEYTIEVSMPGYTSKTVNDLNISGYQTLQILLTPN